MPHALPQTVAGQSQSVIRKLHSICKPHLNLTMQTSTGCARNAMVLSVWGLMTDLLISWEGRLPGSQERQQWKLWILGHSCQPLRRQCWLWPACQRCVIHMPGSMHNARLDASKQVCHRLAPTAALSGLSSERRSYMLHRLFCQT